MSVYVASIHFPYSEACAEQVTVEWRASRFNGVLEALTADEGCITLHLTVKSAQLVWRLAKYTASLVKKLEAWGLKSRRR